MKIKTLTDFGIAELAQVFNTSFEGYFVPIVFSEEAMRERLQRARIDLSMSVGVFEAEQLVAFMLTGVGCPQGQKTAYNAGTGVIPAYRGRRLVKQMYEWALPLWRSADFRELLLEVIVENKYAIKAYESAGLSIKRRVTAFKSPSGNKEKTSNFLFERVPEPNWSAYEKMAAFDFSWDFCQAGVDAIRLDYSFYEWKTEEDVLMGYAIVHDKGRIAQAGLDKESPENWRELLSGLEKYYEQLSWINIDMGATVLIKSLQELGWTHMIDQFEMEGKL